MCDLGSGGPGDGYTMVENRRLRARVADLEAVTIAALEQVALPDEDARALAAFADEGDRRGGCTGYGPRFDAVMAVARKVRAALTGSETCPDTGPGEGES